MNPSQKIWAMALKLLSARMTSRAELLKKLTQRFPNEPDGVASALAEMERVELINDKRYAEQLIHHLLTRPIGRMKIMAETKRRGLPAEMIEGLLLEQGYDEEKEAQKALGGKAILLTETDVRKRKQKLMNYLRGRGFTDRVIFHALKGLSEED